MMKHHLADDKMSVVALDEAARRWAGELEEREARRSGVSRLQARRIVARRTGLAPGTLENIKNRRTKGVRGWVLGVLQAAYVREIENEIARLSHELDMVRLGVLASDGDEILEMEAQRAALRELVG